MASATLPATALPHSMNVQDVLGEIMRPEPLYFQRADASDDDYLVATAAVPAPAKPRVQDVEALMQQFEHDPLAVVIRILTLAGQVQLLADRLQAIDRVASERLNGGAGEKSIEQMRLSLDDRRSREVL